MTSVHVDLMPAVPFQPLLWVIESIHVAHSIGNLGVGMVIERSRPRLAHPRMLLSPALGILSGITAGCGGAMITDVANLACVDAAGAAAVTARSRRSAIRAIVGSLLAFALAWPATHRIIDYAESDMDRAVAVITLVLLLDAVLPRSWTDGLAELVAMMIPGFHTDIEPQTSPLTAPLAKTPTVAEVKPALDLPPSPSAMESTPAKPGRDTSEADSGGPRRRRHHR